MTQGIGPLKEYREKIPTYDELRECHQVEAKLAQQLADRYQPVPRGFITTMTHGELVELDYEIIVSLCDKCNGHGLVCVPNNLTPEEIEEYQCSDTETTQCPWCGGRRQKIWARKK